MSLVQDLIRVEPFVFFVFFSDLQNPVGVTFLMPVIDSPASRGKALSREIDI